MKYKSSGDHGPENVTLWYHGKKNGVFSASTTQLLKTRNTSKYLQSYGLQTITVVLFWCQVNLQTKEKPILEIHHKALTMEKVFS